MESKSEVSKPEIIAFVSDTEIIPFENVIAAYGDVIDGSKRIGVYTSIKDVCFNIIGDDADRFLKEYNNYLAFVEAATITDLTGGKDE